MKDAFKIFYPDLTEYSWYSHQGNGYRYNDTWVSRDAAGRVSQCGYAHLAREQNIKGHSMMILGCEAENLNATFIQITTPWNLTKRSYKNCLNC